MLSFKEQVKEANPSIVGFYEGSNNETIFVYADEPVAISGTGEYNALKFKKGVFLMHLSYHSSPISSGWKRIPSPVIVENV